MKIIILIVTLLVVTGCTQSESKVKRILESDGITEIQLKGYKFMACSESDSFSDEFTGIKNGRKVRGVVCGGWSKGSTIRFY